MPFASYLAQENLTYNTIKTYFAAIRYFHMNSNHLATYTSQYTPRVRQVLQGIQRHQAHTGSRTTRLPITIQIMQEIKAILQQHPHSYHSIMMWATCCVAFFGFLRCNEFTVPSQTGYDPAVHLSYSDVAVDNRDSPTMVVISIKQSKTDPLRKGVQITLGATQDDVCPIKAIMPYLAIRGSQPGPLFLTKDNHFLTQSAFRTNLLSILQEVGLDTKSYNTHSFRIGAATSAESAGLTESQIKSLGRWKSDAYRHYIKPTPIQMAPLSKVLASQNADYIGQQ